MPVMITLSVILTTANRPALTMAATVQSIVETPVIKKMSLNADPMPVVITNQDIHVQGEKWA
jgi:hypothetical protein